MGGYTVASEPVTRKPNSRIATATAPIAVPQIPMKWTWRIGSFMSARKGREASEAALNTQAQAWGCALRSNRSHRSQTKKTHQPLRAGVSLLNYEISPVGRTPHGRPGPPQSEGLLVRLRRD